MAEDHSQTVKVRNALSVDCHDVPRALARSVAGHHVEHIYTKISVCTRAGATLYAMDQGLVGT